MALFNYAAKEVTLKIVYYGPGLSGKTTNLQHLHASLNTGKTGKLISLATETDRTLFFDFLPIDLGKIKDFTVRFQLYTVPGQIKYNLTRKAVLKGADAVIFVADSQKEVREGNIESFANMMENLISNNINPDNLVLILQYNKRDLPNLLSIDELNKDVNKKKYIYLEAEAINGKGVEETFQTAIKLLINDLAQRHKLEIKTAAAVAEPRQTIQEKIEQPAYEKTLPIEKEPIPVEEESVQMTKETITPEEEPFSIERELVSEEREVIQKEEPIPIETSQVEETVPLEKPIETKTETIPLREKTEYKPIAEEKPVPPPYRPFRKPEFPVRERPEPEKPKPLEPTVYSPEQLEKIAEGLRENKLMIARMESLINELLEELRKSREEQKGILDMLREININEKVEKIKEKQKGWLSKKI